MRHILYFTADWCQPCKKVRPIVEELNKDSLVKFQILDADIEKGLLQVYQVRSVPTFILLEHGIEIYRLTGAQTKDKLEELINYVKTDTNTDI